MVIMDEQKILLNLIRIDTSQIKKIKVLQPRLIFSDYQPKEELLTPIHGLRKYGPYDVNTSDRVLTRRFNGIEFHIFYPKGEDTIFNRLKELMTFLKDGYFEKRDERDVEFRGFKEEFRLKDVFIPEPNEYVKYEPGKLSEKVISINYEEALQRGNVPIAIIGGVSHKSLRINRELYLESKMVFTMRNIASQYASFYERGDLGILCKVTDRRTPFGFSLWNFALNIYGKCGGLAWIVPQSLSKESEEVVDLTIGLRFVKAPVMQGQGKQRFYVGYATIIDRFGRLVGVVSSRPFYIPPEVLMTSGMVVPYDVLNGMIKEALGTALSDVRFKKIFEAKQTINIAVHRLSIFNREEISAIFSAIKSQMLEKVTKIGLVSIVNAPSLLFFDVIDDRITVEDYEAITLNKNTALMYTARPSRRMAYPIAIKVLNLAEKGCLFNTLEEACNHIASLNALHWQTVIPGSVKLPASLEFAQDIARLSSYNILPQRDSWLWKTLWFI